MDFLKILKDNLSDYSYSTDIPLSVIDERGNVLFTIGECSTFCQQFSEATKDLCPCSDTHLYASKQAEKLGETYFFSCPSGLIHYTVPILESGAFRGAVIAGPVLLDFPDSMMVDDVIQKFNLGISMRGALNSKLRSVPVIEPTKVGHMGKLLYVIVTYLLGEDKLILQERNRKLHQQSRINESIQDLKSTDKTSLYPYESEKELMMKVKNKDIIGARSILNDMLGYIFFSSGGDMEIMKRKTFALCTLLSRASVEGGANLDKIFELNDNAICKLYKIENLEELSFWILNILDKFTESVFTNLDPKNAIIIQKSITYINTNYNRNITLDMVANNVHLNSSYFSGLFKKEMGVSYSNYLNGVRIEQSKFLLESTGHTIMQIALEVGFEEQSYFAKVFKSITGQTPKEYKQKAEQY